MSSPTGPVPTEPAGPVTFAGPADQGPSSDQPWYRNRFLWVAVVLLVVAATAVVLVRAGGSNASPQDLRGQLDVRLLTLLEEVDPEDHGGHGEHINQAGEESKVVCGVHTFAFEPKTATTMADVDRVYAYHLCGIAEPKKPWDWAVKLVGPLIVGLKSEPPTIEVAEATENVTYRERVVQMFPPEYQDQAFNAFLTKEGFAELRRRYDAAAGL